MGRDIGQLAGVMTRLAKAIPRETSRLKGEVSKAILIGATINTPVDTSLHMSNWQVGIGSPPSGVLEAAVPGSGGNTKGSSGAITIAIGASKLVGKLVGNTIYVSNESPVIEGLNSGNVISDQDGGFVEKGLARGKDAATKFKFKL